MSNKVAVSTAFVVRACASLGALILTAALPSAHAQDTKSVYQEQGKLIRAARDVTALGPDAFGDKVNLYTGALEFVHTDVSLPGNSALPVSVGRRFRAGEARVYGRMFGDWDLEIPHLHGVFSTAKQWTTANGSNANARCSAFGPPPMIQGSFGSDSIWNGTEYWHGSFLYVPGQGDQEMLRRASATQTPTGTPGATYPVVTRNNWSFRCLAAMDPRNGGSGEAFIAISPDGTEYRFDWMVSRSISILSKSNALPEMGSAELPEGDPEQTRSAVGGTITPTVIAGNQLARSEVWILPTVITDRFGNTVTYTYDTTNKWQLNSIVANDASGSPRTLTLSYETPGSPTSNRITAVSDGLRTWTYAYDGVLLQTVTLPDDSRWQLGELAPLVNDLLYSSGGGCESPGTLTPTTRTGTLVHPSGARGEFTLTPTRHGRSGVEKLCLTDVSYQYETPFYPKSFDTFALTRKSISGPGLPAMAWLTSYSAEASSWAPLCAGCSSTKQVEVTDPAGHKTRHTFGTLFRQTEGQLQSTDTIDSGMVLRSVVLRYAEPIAPLGVSDQRRGDGDMAARVMETDRRQTIQQGVTFTWQASNYNNFAQPQQVTRSSSLASRTEKIAYHNNAAKWILGQVESVTEVTNPIMPKVMVLNVYNASTSVLESVTRFGITGQKMSYNADGTLATRADGAGNVTRFYDYKRGLARSVVYPDSSTEGAVVNDYGAITSTTDPNGYTTSYDYDAIGRLYRISPPTGDSDGVVWNQTVLSFAPVWSDEYDLPAGHWRQDVTTGNARTSTYFDGFWRPVYTVSQDMADPANTTQIVKRSFDHAGRTTYSSYPGRGIANTGVGVRTVFDALGRVKETIADSGIGLLRTTNAFVTGFKKTYTDGRGNSTTTGYQAFDTPTEDAITTITAPANLTVVIARDLFGKPLSVSRSGDGASAVRTYVYDPNERLCKTIEPETGATLQDYDSANNVLWRAPGTSLTAAACDRASVPLASRISFGYDAMNRLTFTSYGDSSPGVTRTYSPDGLPKTVVSAGATWTLDYNRLRLPTTQVLNFGGQNYTLTTLYDANGHPSQLNYPTEGNPIAIKSVAYAPDALGRPTQVGTFATGIRYHPSGAVASFTYGNGKVRTMTQNVRGLPELASDTGVVQDRYAYDANGNVTSIVDELPGGAATRTLGYDALDRLTTANAPGLWGNASYSYDVLDNIKSSTIGNRISTYSYNAKNLLSTLNSTASGFSYTFGYDARGNVTTRGAQQFVFDLGNRLQSATGLDAYVYDGFGRRVQTSATSGAVTVSVYSPAGQLLYTRRSGGPDPAKSTEYIYLHQHQIAEVSR